MSAFVSPALLSSGSSLFPPLSSKKSFPSSSELSSNRIHTSRPRRPRPSSITTACSFEPSDSPDENSDQNDSSSAPFNSSPGFILWGPPGSGKTSLCETLSHTHGLVHISTGSLLRAHVLYETEWGLKSRPYVSTTAPVPDEIVIPMVLERLRQKDVKERGFLLDGFPRTARQHVALASAGFSPRLAIMLHAPRDTLSRRIRYRRLDPETDVLYNLKLRPPASQEVLERLVVLAKDSAANVAQLFESYGRATAETFDLLAASAVRVDGDRKFDDVLTDVARAIAKQGASPFNESKVGGGGDDGSDDLQIPSPPPPRTNPSVVTPPNAWGRASAVKEVQVDPSGKPMTAAAALRTRQFSGNNNQNGSDGNNTDKDNMTNSTLYDPDHYNSNNGNNTDVSGVIVGTKSKITLIRCDGYICERESVEESQIAFRGSATEQVMLVWNARPRTVLLLVKKDPELMKSVLEAAKYMSEVEQLDVMVESWVQTQALANGMFLETFSKPDTLHERVDFVVCLGGDGLILHVSTLFRTAVPPVISFNLGSLGFLTPFQYDNFREEIQALLRGNCNLSLRMRLSCQIDRKKGDDNAKNKDSSRKLSRAETGMFSVLNEVVVDRGASPYLSNLDCFCDGKYITTVQADGIIMSTPTGSTAYSMSAGGSMVHPSVPAILFTPICPHSLSFRPIVFPDSAEIRIEIAEDARSHAWASFDGKSRQQLKRGDGLVVKMNLFPVPTVNKTDHTGDWFQSLDRAFNFNSRAGQKPLAKMDDNEIINFDDENMMDNGDENANDNGHSNGNQNGNGNGNGNVEINADVSSSASVTSSGVSAESKDEAIDILNN